MAEEIKQEKTEKIEEKKIENTETKKVEEKKESKPAEKKLEAKPEIKTEKAEKKGKEAKIILEREYIVPLRRKISTVPRYRRAKKAVRVLKEFIAKHMRVDDRDIRNVKVDIHLNNELWFRGIKKPQAKIKVIAKKFDNGIVTVELGDITEARRWMIEKDKKEKEKVEKSSAKMPKHVAKEAKEETAEQKTQEKEKQAAVVEAGLKSQKQEAKQMKHDSGKQKAPEIHRMALKK